MSNALKQAMLGAAVAGFVTIGAAQVHADYLVDNIFDLTDVRDISLNGKTGTIMVTLPNKILQFSTFPLEVTADVGVQIDGITSVATEDNTLVVMGDDSKRELSGGSILVYRDMQKSLSQTIEPIVYPLDITPFSQSMLTEDGQVFAVNPTWFSVVQFSVQGLIDFMTNDNVLNWRTNDVYLTCGPASKVSVFKHNEKDYFVTSVTGRKLIEYGVVDLNNRKPAASDCFSAESASRSKTVKNTSRQTLLHQLIKSPFEGYEENSILKRVLTFDPDTALLSLFPFREFRGRIAILRSERVELDLTQVLEEAGVPASRFALMAASNDATVIYVSFVGSTSLHRLREFDGDLEYLGRVDFEDPIKLIDVSLDGRMAAVVTGDVRRGESDEIVLIKNPREIEDNGPLKRERFSVLNMQRLLVAQGYQLQTDGIYGQQTQQAVDAFLTNGQVAAPTVQPDTVLNSATRSVVITGATEAPDADSQLVVPGISTNNSPEIGNNLRGLFPLEVYGPSR